MISQKIKCIVIDDEPVAIDILSEYILKIPFLELSSTFRNALLAIEFLQKNKVDLIFLDINMPEINGIEFLKSLNIKPKVIFTTAYSEFAVESYELNALDYLLKPITFERFLKAVNKINSFQDSQDLITEINIDSVILKSGTKSYKTKIDEILFIEGSGNYLTFNLTDKKLMVLMSMTEALNILPESKFARIHKSFVVALDKINTIENHQVQISNKTIPVGKHFKESFLKKVNN